MSILEYLAEKELLDKKSISSIKEEARNSDKSLDSVLEERGISHVDLMQAKSDYFNMPVRDLTGVEVPFDILKYIPEESATHYKFGRRFRKSFRSLQRSFWTGYKGTF